MVKRLDLRGIIVKFSILTFFVCSVKNVYSSQMITELPFDLGEWVAWSVPIDKGEATSDGRYKYLELSKNEMLQQLIDNIYPQYFNDGYYVLQSDKTDCVLYLIISSPKVGYRALFHLVNVRNNKEIASLPVGGLIDPEGERKNFTISKDLKITLFDEKFYYDEEEERVIVTERKKTGTYQIQKDGQIVRIDDKK